MDANPYIHIEKVEDSHVAQFALTLDSIAPAWDESKNDYNAFLQTLLNRQSDFIASLVGLGRDAVIELRSVCAPDSHKPQEGTIKVVLRIAVEAKQESMAKSRAQELAQALLPNVLGITSHYSWSVVSSAEEFCDLLPETTAWHLREMVRREQLILLDQPHLQRPMSGIGFAGVVSEQADAVGEGAVYICFPFVRNYATQERIFSELLIRTGRTVLSVTLHPTRATEQENQFWLDQLLACERYMQLPLTGTVGDPRTFFPSFRQQAQILGEQISSELHVLRDDLFFTTISVLSEHPIPALLCESIGVSITEHLQSADPDSDSSVSSRSNPYSGGFEWLSPESDQRSQAITNLRTLQTEKCTLGLETSQLRLRKLLDINQASCAFRLPIPLVEEFPGVKSLRVRELPPPSNAKDGLCIGQNRYRSVTSDIFMQPQDRLRHTYVIGKTGTGKSTFLKYSIMQDIWEGQGVGVFDPHGELIDQLVNCIPDHRIDDVILIKPEIEEYSIGLNLLDVRTDMERDSVISYLIEVFDMIYDLERTGGPVFEMYFRNAMMLLMQHKIPSYTLMDLHRVFENGTFRRSLIDECRDEPVAHFWAGQAHRASGDLALENVAPYITSKLVRLTHSPVMRKIFSQSVSTIDFQDIMDNRKILLVDLSKGFLGNLNSNFLGMVLIKLIQLNAFRRSPSVPGYDQAPFYLYFDEFQNLATPSFLDLLSESRKYGLGMILANQYIQQIPEDIRNAIVGNVGSLVSFRVGLKDAEVLEDSFAPELKVSHFVNLPNFNAYVSMLKRGDVCRPFNISTQHRNYSVTPGGAQRIYQNLANYAEAT